MTTNQKTILITGATAGIGRETALYLAKQGHHVIATGRKVAELAKLRDEAATSALSAKGIARRASVDRALGRETITNLRPRLDTLVLDVNDVASITAAVEQVAKLTEGRALDVLVNNAGFGILGPTIEISDADMRRQFETNVFGLMNVVRAFVPQMRDAGGGRIVNVSSVGGRLTMPYFGAYNATKYALESLSDALRYELQPFGIHVSLSEPGVIKTSFEATAVSGLDRFATTAYARAIANYEVISRQVNRMAGKPISVAKAIERATDARFPSARYVAPRSNYVALFLSKALPQRVWDWAMRTVARINKRTVTVETIQPAQPAPASPSGADLHTLPPSGFEIVGRASAAN